ncbi:helix-turn-helix domain-containing protein [Neobacillus citreus]|uniref:Helix-turn-helix domain-containing protein n=1 Tax=Neobacillus citreus TaxID=2833578 RepID=A0A942YBZ5_9BACI|nr:helix-turn-helix domain-containing protein [Neobacillus citreus]MCH6267195.1 helix-turn-helix domain-containing protein [Neobacillus citreus]
MMNELNVHVILDKMMKEAEKNDIKNGRFYVANPSMLLRNRYLTSGERLVLMELFYWYQSRNERKLHQPTICENVGLSDKTVRESLKGLETKGFISSKRTGKVNVYTLLDFSINPIIVLGIVIREFEHFITNLEKDSQLAYKLFKPIWEDKTIYEGFLAKIEAVETSEERYNTAKLLVKQYKKQKLETSTMTKAKLRVKRKVKSL